MEESQYLVIQMMISEDRRVKLYVMSQAHLRGALIEGFTLRGA